MKRHSLLLAGVLLLSNLTAQIINPEKVRYGKVSDAELALTNYPLQPDADAVILFDQGKLRMEYDDLLNNFEIVLERHLRIKILQAAGVDNGNFSFVLEHSTASSAEESISSIKGVTLNEVDGKIEETKLGKAGTFREKISEQLDKLSISFPQVKAGSIIDLKYVYKSDFLFNLPTWYFQRSIPTDYSHFEAVIPEYYQYNLNMQGYTSQSLIENVNREVGSRALRLGPTNQETVNFRTNGYRWTAVEVPGLSGEVYAPQVSNYFFRVGFELSSVNFPGQYGRNFTQSWEDVTETYRDNANHRPYMNPRREVQELTAGWTAEAQDELSKVLIVYEGVKNQLEWNGNYRMIPEQTPAGLLKTSSGSSAELNYLLLSALRAAGLTAYPVLVSTRENGYLTLTHPSLTQFNHLLVYVSLNEGQSYALLDATHRDVPVPLLPTADLNDRGRVITDESSEWITLQAPASYKTAHQLQLSVDEEGHCTGSMKYKSSDYAALFDRQKAGAEDGMAGLVGERLGYPLREVAVADFSNSYSDLILKADVDVTDGVIQNDDLLYVPAVLTSYFSENPLKAEERVLPIDFSTPQEYVYTMKLELPEGMQLEELPESIEFAISEGKARYSLRYIDINGDVQIVEKITFKERFFSAEDYAALKQFFDLVVEQQQGMLVLRKT